MIYRVKIRDYWYAENATGLPINFISWAAANDVMLVSLNQNIPAEVVKFNEKVVKNKSA